MPKKAFSNDEWNKKINDYLRSPGVDRPDLVGKIKVYAHTIEDQIK